MRTSVLIIGGVVGVLVTSGYVSADEIGPKGCPGGYDIARPNGTLAHFCSESYRVQASLTRPSASIAPRREEHQAGAERFKLLKPRSMGGHASAPGSFVRQASAPQSIRCLAEERNLSDVYGVVSRWFRVVIYGDHDKRVLTQPAAYSVRDKIFAYIKREISIGRGKFAAARRGEDADGLCADHMIGARLEALRVFNIVKSEGARGNRDLEGTGLNPRTSVYNK